jgi:NADH/NAD ratio-sensing transcriptional regulator Rex
VRQCYDMSRVSHYHQMLNQLLVDKIPEAFDLRMAENVPVDSSCAGSQAGRGRALRADIAGAMNFTSKTAIPSTLNVSLLIHELNKTEKDLTAHMKSLFFCLLLHLNQQYWLLLSEVVLPMKPCQEMIY